MSQAAPQLSPVPQRKSMSAVSAREERFGMGEQSRLSAAPSQYLSSSTHLDSNAIFLASEPNPEVDALDAVLTEMLQAKDDVHNALGMKHPSSSLSGMSRSSVLLGTLLNAEPDSNAMPSIPWAEVERRLAMLGSLVDRCQAMWLVVRRDGQAERAQGFAHVMRVGSTMGGTAARFGSGSVSGYNSTYKNNNGSRRESASLFSDQRESHWTPTRILPLGGMSSRASSRLSGDRSPMGGSPTRSTLSDFRRFDDRYTAREVSSVASQEIEWRSQQRRWFQSVEKIIMEGRFALLEARRIADDWRDRCQQWADPLERAMHERNFSALIASIGAVTSEAPDALQNGPLRHTIANAREFAQKMKDAAEDAKSVIESQSDLAVWSYLDTYQSYVPAIVIMELRALAAKREEYKHRFRYGFPMAVHTPATAAEALQADAESKRIKAEKVAEMRRIRQAAMDELLRELMTTEGELRQYIRDEERKLRIMLTRSTIESEAEVMGILASQRKASSQQRGSQLRSASSRPHTAHGSPTAGRSLSPGSEGWSRRVVSFSDGKTRHNVEGGGGNGSSSPLLHISPPPSLRQSPRGNAEGGGGPHSNSNRSTSDKMLEVPLFLGDQRKSSYALLHTRRTDSMALTSLSAIPTVETRINSRAPSTADLVGAASRAANKYISHGGSFSREDSPLSAGPTLTVVPALRTTSRLHFDERVVASGGILGVSPPSKNRMLDTTVRYSFRRAPSESDDEEEGVVGRSLPSGAQSLRDLM